MAANFTNKPVVEHLLPFPCAGSWKVRFNSDWKGYSDDFTDTQIGDIVVEKDKGKVNLGPYSVIILSLDS